MLSIRFRDPIHGAIEVSDRERAIIRSPFYRRLHSVKQLGFADIAFPSASHSRYAHGLGAMHLATRMFDQALPEGSLPGADRLRLRRAVRLAALLHDLGHPPMSHSSEVAMPPVGRLGLNGWAGDDPQRRATHEDYTLAMLLRSELSRQIEQLYGDDGVPPTLPAALVSGHNLAGDEAFRSGGVDYFPLLRQLVSSELDADRMDYLRRDAAHCGVPYGHYDLDWLIEHLAFVVRDDRAYLALTKRAIFAFEDFLLSRYHMFISVYHHHVPICFDQMLGFYLREAADECELPADIEQYLACDDVLLNWTLRQSTNVWARRIVRGHSFHRLLEFNEFDSRPDITPLLHELQRLGIETFTTESRSQVSTYFGHHDAFPLFVVMAGQAEPVPVTHYTPLFARYEEGAGLHRLYCHPDHAERARPLAARLLDSSLQPSLPAVGEPTRASVSLFDLAGDETDESDQDDEAREEGAR